MRYTPPREIKHHKNLKKSVITIALSYAFCFSTATATPENVINNSYLESDGDSYPLKTTIIGNKKFESIDLNFSELPSEWNQLVIAVENNSSLEITGDTYFHSKSSTGTSAKAGVYAIHSKGTTNLLGNVDILMTQNVDPEYGFNAIYAVGADGRVNIGSEGSTTRIWVLGSKPDAISAKQGGIVEFKSTHNQIVGTFDLWDNDQNTSGHESLIKGTFSGDSSYWFGDDTSTANSRPPVSLGGTIIIPGNNNNGVLNLIFENGAQWSYLGFGNPLYNVYPTAYKKRISNITLRNGGIINLADAVLLGYWDDIGLLDQMEGYNVNHDLVEIGDLKGNGGIFRLDLNAENKSLSDVVFIEYSSDPGIHSLEPYQLDKLRSITPENTLIFAFVDSSASAVKFTDKVNLEGESLYDYELTIDSSLITEDDLQAEEIKDKKIEGQDKEDYIGGTKWFIKRVTLSESAASIGMRSAGYASYDLAVNMDRRDRRLQNAVFQNEEKDGLWARVQYGEAGAEHLYNADLTTVYVGYEKAISVDNRLGFSFAYTDGESDLNDLKGSGDLKRYEASVYDTLTFGSHYLDFVARFGQVDNEFDVTNQSGALTTSGSFDQKYAALSAEYGYNFKDEHNVFIEPQVQLQVAYLGDYNYRTERNMKVDADNDISVIGRVGLRTGKTFESSDYVGELYARADVLHQFTDGQDAQFSDLSDKVNVTWGNKDTWSTFGVGGYLNWKDNVSFQVDVERTAGGETIDTWLVSGRVNYLF